MGTIGGAPRRVPQYDSAAWLVTVIAVAMGAVGAGHLLVDSEPLVVLAVELALLAVPVSAVVYGGYRLASGGCSADERWRIAKHVAAGAAVAALFASGYAFASWLGSSPVRDLSFFLPLITVNGALVSLFASMSTDRPEEDQASDRLADRWPTADGEAIVRQRYDWSSTSPNVAVVEAIAAVENVRPAALDLVLHDHVPTDALEALVTGDANTTVAFSVEEYSVRIDGDVLTLYPNGEGERREP